MLKVDVKSDIKTSEAKLGRSESLKYNKSLINEFTKDWDVEVKSEGSFGICILKDSWSEVLLTCPNDYVDDMFESEDGLFYELKSFKKISDLPFTMVDLLVYNIDHIMMSYIDLREKSVNQIIRWLKPIVNVDVYETMVEWRNSFSLFAREKYDYVASMIACQGGVLVSDNESDEFTKETALQASEMWGD